MENNTNIANNVHRKLQKARVLIQNKNLKKSGYNSYTKFNYYELGDFMPAVNQVFDELGLTSCFSINEKYAELCITNIDAPFDQVKFASILPNTFDSKGSNPLQQLGATHTYLKRYLYLNALELVENDITDATIGKPEKRATNKPKEDVQYRLSNAKSLDDLNQVLSDFKGNMSQEAKILLHKTALNTYHAVYDDTVGKYVAEAVM